MALPSLHNADNLDASILETINDGFRLALDALQSWASLTSLDNLLTIFGQGDTDQLNITTWETLQTSWQQSNFTQLPTLELRSAQELNQAQGAYGHSTQTIYLSSDFISSASPQAIARVLLEEIGHFLDAQVNSIDTPGDEGALFAAQVLGIELSESTLGAIKSENDNTTLTLNGQTIDVEKMDPYSGDNLDQFQTGLNSFLTTLEETIDQVVYGQNLPLIGSALENVSDGAVDFIAELREPVLSQLDGIQDLTVTALEQALMNALGEGGLGWLEEINVIETADDLRFDLLFSRDFLQVTETDLDLSLGNTGLGLDISGGAEINVGFDWHLIVGVNGDGFYVDTSDENDLSLHLQGSVPDLTATGTLGLLQVDAEDNGSLLDGSINVDILGNGGNADATLNAEATLSLDLSTGTTLPILPTIGTNLLLSWDFSEGIALNASQDSTPTIEFNNLTVDTGSLFGNFFGPVFEGINTVLDPLTPFIDALTFEFPIIKKSTIELLPFLIAAFGGEYNEESAEFVKVFETITDIISIANNIDVDGTEITLGNFNYSSDDETITPGDDNPDAVGQLGELGIDIGDGARLDFPLFSDPLSIINLFLGQPVDILDFSLPTLGFGISATQTFPIPGFPPIKLTLSESFGAAASFGFGYDSKGLQDYINSVIDGTPDPTLLSNGFYVYAPPNADFPDPIEPPDDANVLVGLGIAVDAGARLTLGPAFIEPRVGIVPQLFLELGGADEDNKVRLADFANPPSCFITPSGSFDVRFSLIGGFGFGPFAVQHKLVEKRTTVADFRAGCHHTASDTDHQQATVGDDGEAELSIGDAAEALVDVEGITDDEFFTISHVAGVAGNETISVEAYGASWNYENVSLIVGDAGAGDDVIDLTGVLSDAVISGGADYDEIYGGEGDDELNGDGGSDLLEGGGGDDTLNGGDDNDFLSGGAGNDTLNGDEGRDTVSYADAASGVVIDLINQIATDDGDGGQDTLQNIEQVTGSDHADTIQGSNDNSSEVGDVILGRDGNDTINGGAGNDFIIGGGGADYLNGGAGNDRTSYLESEAEVHIDLEDGNVFSGAGSDADGDFLEDIEGVQGTQQDDILRGDDEDNQLSGAGGNDILEGRGGADELDGGLGHDTAEYVDSPDGVTVTLQAAAAEDFFSIAGVGGHAAGDQLAMAFDSEGNPIGRNTIENLTGSFHNDALTGDGGRNILKGLAGNDTLDGDDGNDWLIGGTGADAHNGGEGLDWADYSDSDAGVIVNLAGNFGLGGDATGDTFNSVENLKGTDFDDALWGNGANNDINPGLSSPGAGLDLVNGGGESSDRGDRLILNYSSTSLSFQGGYDYADGNTKAGSFTNHIAFDDIEQLHITSSYLNDTIQGGTGDDFVNSGDGNDTVFGGRGHNHILADDGDDQVTNFNNEFGDVFYTPDTDEVDGFWMDGGAGIDTFSGNFANYSDDIVLTSLNPDQENSEVQLSLEDGSFLYGFERFGEIQTGRGDDQLTQLGRVNNDFRTGAGNDTVNTGLGLDNANGGSSPGSIGALIDPDDDLLVVDYSVEDVGTGLTTELANRYSGRYYRNTANDTTLLDEVQFSNFERVHVDGTQHGDLIIGLIGNDELRGHAGNDVLSGQDGDDNVFGGIGHDIIWGNDGDDELSGGQGNDFIIDNVNEDNQGGQDILNGNSGNDVLIGGAGDDSLNGGSGNDNLIGIAFGEVPFPAPPEIDTLTGGAGADRFWLGDGLFAYYDSDGGFVDGLQNQAIVTDFTLAQGDVVQLHGVAADYSLVESNGNTLIFRQGIELIGTLQGVTGLSLGGPAFQYVNGETEEEFGFVAPTLPEDSDLPDGFQQAVVNDTQLAASLLLPAVQASAAQPSAVPIPYPNLSVLSKPVQPVKIQNPEEPIALNNAVETIEDKGFSITQENNTSILKNLFTGDTTGLEILDVSITGDARGFGTFQYEPFGLGSGLVLSTGKVTDLVGPNKVDGGLVGKAEIPLEFVKLSAKGGLGINDTITIGDKNAPDFEDTITIKPPAPDQGDTAIFRADLSDLSRIQSLLIADGGDGGGAGGDHSGFDLDAIKISSVLIDDADDIDEIPGLDVFDFSPLGTYLKPGTQRASNSFPIATDLAGTVHGQVNNGLATLHKFDYSQPDDTGFVSLGDGGSVGFDLAQVLEPDGPLYLYVAEAGNNGETLDGQITASTQRINAQDELSTDFGTPGADNDATRLSMTFEADRETQQVYFQFVFASEEFVEFGGSEFNDVLNLKLNGINLARLSDGASANINNLVPISYGDYHPDFIHNPADGGPASTQTPLDGYTQVLTFAGPVNAGELNQLEIEVKDIGDGWKDTAVFLQAGSFGTNETPRGELKTRFDANNFAEGGNTTPLSLSLGTVPLEDVKVTLNPDEQLNLGNGGGKPVVLTFTPETAFDDQLLTVVAVDDLLMEGLHQGEIEITTNSDSLIYDSLLVDSLILSIQDNDIRRVATEVIPEVINLGTSQPIPQQRQLFPEASLSAVAPFPTEVLSDLN